MSKSVRVPIPWGGLPRLSSLRPGHVLVDKAGILVLKVTSRPKDGAVWTRVMKGRELTAKKGFWSISQMEIDEFGFRLRSKTARPDRWARS